MSNATIAPIRFFETCISTVTAACFGMFSSLQSNSIVIVTTGIVGGYLASRIVYLFYFSPLSNIKGPFISIMFPISLLYHLSKGKAQEYQLKQHQKYGQVLRAGPYHVSLTNPEDWKRLLASHRYVKGMTPLIKIFGAPNIFTTDDPEINKARRRLIKPAFTTTHIAAMEQSILEAGPIALKRKIDQAIEDHENSFVFGSGSSNSNSSSSSSSRDKKENKNGTAAKINHVDDFQYMALDVIGELAFGGSFGMLNGGQQSNTVVLDGVHSMNLISMLEVMIPYFDKFERLVIPSMVKKVDDFLEFTRQVIYKRIEETTTNTPAKSTKEGKSTSPQLPPPPVPQDILQVFIEAYQQGSAIYGLKEADLVSEICTQMFAGTDTSSTTLSWTLFLLMVYPETYKKVCEEIRTTYPDRSKPITYTEGLSKLPYLEAVIYESMRIQPTSANSLTRIIPEPGFELSNGQFLPAGTECLIPIYSIHHDEQFWKDHHKFLPDRFLVSDKNGAEDVSANKKNLMIFSSGIRVCPGRNLAMCKIFMTLANILRDYDFWLPEDMVEFGPDVIDDETGEPKIIPGFLGITYTPRYSERDGWICVKHNVAPSQ
ncbi:hypothetical protein H4219_004405 [Mycoemilia scoparia]|uniref:Cytochrome P450 n=1 Tax=Mycoemilia scoparia TaxID=417184 RepID=A0A9W8DRF3_9FUNG|nr:hypothetical protein H4219_004405 [Mycoemilia scoparia]